jgi:hypothetical protein
LGAPSKPTPKLHKIKKWHPKEKQEDICQGLSISTDLYIVNLSFDRFPSIPSVSVKKLTQILMFKPYIVSAVLLVFLTGCSLTSVKKSIKNRLPAASTENIILEKIANNAFTLSLGEIVSYDWEYLRFIRPYQTKKIHGQTLSQPNNKACQWVILGKNSEAKEVILETFSIDRATLDCIDLPDKVFGKSDTIFLVRDGKLKERKKFKR